MSDYYQGRGGYANGGGYSNGRGGYGGRGNYGGRGEYNGGRGSGLTYAERQALRRITLQQEVERTLMLQRVLANGVQDPTTIMTLMGAMNGGAGGSNDALLMATMLQGQHAGNPVNGAAAVGNQQNQVAQVADSVRDLTHLVASLRADVTALRNGNVELSPLGGARYPILQQLPNFAPAQAAPNRVNVPAVSQAPVNCGQAAAVNGADMRQLNDEGPPIPAPVDLSIKQLIQDALDAAGNPPSSVEMFKKVNSWGLDEVKAVFNHYLPGEPYANKGQGVFQLVEFLMKNLRAVGQGMGLW